MSIQIALVAAVIFQFGAFLFTISLIPKTKFNIAWISISAGFLLMAFRRLSDLFTILNTDASTNPSILSSWISVMISITMLIASIYIRKIFDLLNQLIKLHKENERRVLSAIITTEERERKFFAKELHDGVGPVLSAMKMTLSAMDKSKLETTNKQLLGKVEQAADIAIRTTKEISNHLNPQVLERFGLEKAIQTFSSQIIVNNNFKLHITSQLQNQRFNSETEVILYRISCELINNTLKHAAATQGRISLYSFMNHIEFMYEDNGIGFNTTDEHLTGMGLTNIKSRVKSLNGEFILSSKPGNGLFLKIMLPL
ncbi:MAG: sensor histidine kinase [Marinilabiliaceae bacterium]|nr:sensor histidine kinase [Marinilabiliaceae bacterium]